MVRKFLRLAVVVAMLGGAVLAAPQSFGADTWTRTLLDFTYSITPAPGTKEVGYEKIYSLTLGSVLTISSTNTEMEIFEIVAYDDSGMGEHTMVGPDFTGSSYTFNLPGQYLIYFKSGGHYRASFELEVN